MSELRTSSLRAGGLALGALLALAGCGGTPESPDAGADAAVDAFVATDTGTTRDANLLVDSGVDTYDLQETAFNGFIGAFCTCAVDRSTTGTTMAECLEINEGDTAVAACSELGFRATAGLSDRYLRCRATALDAATACISASDCSEAASDACEMTLGSASTACEMMITDPGRTAYTPAFNTCIQEMISGPEGECPESLTAVSTIGPSAFSGTTDLQGDDTVADCDETPNSFAPDRGYLWAAPATGTYTIDTIGSEFDTILYVREACLSATSIACNDDIEMGVMRQSQVEIDLEAGDEVVIIVDGWQNEHGNFVVNITAGALPPTDGGVVADAGTGDAGTPDGDAGVDAGDMDAGVAPPIP